MKCFANKMEMGTFGSLVTIILKLKLIVERDFEKLEKRK